MNKAKFTPGPWVVIPRSESSGRSVGTVEPAPQTMTSVNYWTVADVNSLRPEWQANLRLIAAAPLLLEALKVCADRLAIHMKHSEDLVAHMQAHDAIAAALGGAA